MPMRYFPHQISTQRDPKIVRLKHEHGMAGYGVYWSLLEMLYETDDCEMELDTYAISVLLGCEAELVACVINDFNLFTVDSERGRFWSEAARRTMDEYMAEQRAKREFRSERARKAVSVRWTKRETQEPTEEQKTEETLEENTEVSADVDVQTTQSEEENTDETVTPGISEDSDAIKPNEEDSPSQTADAVETDESTVPEAEAEPVSAPVVETTPTSVVEDSAQSTSARLSEFLMAEPIYEPPKMQDESVGVMPEVCEMIILKWNQAVAGTKQVYRGLILDSMSYFYLKQAFELRYTITEIEEAIDVASKEDFPWTLKSVLKPDNLQILLAKKEKNFVQDRKRKPGARTKPGETADTTEAFGINWESYGTDPS